MVHVGRAVEALPGIARCHVYRIGDGGAHLHVFFFARPEGFGQLRGSFLVVWDDLLPPSPQDEVTADARARSPRRWRPRTAEPRCDGDRIGSTL